MKLQNLMIVALCVFVLFWYFQMVGLGSIRITHEPQSVVQEHKVKEDSTQSSEIGLHMQNVNKLPESTIVPRIVHFVWCLKNGFRFNNYLSMKSIVKYLDPDKLLFHYASLPKVDFFHYETWFDKLQSDIPVFQLSKFVHDGVCNSTKSKRQFIANVLYDVGGIYVEEFTVFAMNMQYLYDIKITVRLGIDGGGYVAVAPGKLISGTTDITRNKQFCPSFETIVSSVPCFSIRTRVYPKTFWNRKDFISQTVNTLLYGVHGMPNPQRIAIRTMQYIAHVLWLDGRYVD
jgi:hypothetical protein